MRRISLLPKLLPIVIGSLLFVAPARADAPTYHGYPVAQVLVNGQPISSDVPPIVMDGRTLLPLRAAATALGAKVGWDANQGAATIDMPGAQLQGQISDLQAQKAALQAQVDQLKKQVQDNSQTVFLPGSATAKVTLTKMGFTDGLGSGKELWVLATNSGTDNITHLAVKGTVYDANNLPVNSSHHFEQYTASNLILRPGESLPIMLYWDSAIDVTTNVKLEVSADTTARPQAALEVTKSQFAPADFGGKYVGTITNHEGISVTPVIYVVTYDQNGYPAHVQAFRADAIPAGQSGNFKSYSAYPGTFKIWVGIDSL